MITDPIIQCQKYDVLRALDYFQDAKIKYNNRMDDALELLFKKCNSDQKQLLQAKHSGQVHVEMETAGKTKSLEYFKGNARYWAFFGKSGYEFRKFPYWSLDGHFVVIKLSLSCLNDQ